MESSELRDRHPQFQTSFSIGHKLVTLTSLDLRLLLCWRVREDQIRIRVVYTECPGFCPLTSPESSEALYHQPHGWEPLSSFLRKNWMQLPLGKCLPTVTSLLFLQTFGGLLCTQTHRASCC